MASLDLTEGADEGDAGSRAKVNANEISGKDENDPAHVNITTVPPDSARSMSKDTSEGLVVLGYFRVTARGAGLRTGDSDKSMLCALNAQGLGLLCSVQDGTEVVSVPEFVQIVGFSEDAQRDLPLKWEVVQEPFLPRRVLQECAASAQEADGGRDEAAAALVNVCTVNLRVQEAYVKSECKKRMLNARGGGHPGLAQFLDELAAECLDTPVQVETYSFYMYICVECIHRFLHVYICSMPTQSTQPYAN